MVCFEHTTPNNTLPILWYEELIPGLDKKWNAIFPRFTNSRMERGRRLRMSSGFWLSAVQKMNMPTTMEYIDDRAFVNTSLVEVNLRVTEPFELGEDVFSEIHVTRLNVPAAGLQKFKNHPKWGKFGRITPTHSYWTVDLP